MGSLASGANASTYLQATPNRLTNDDADEVAWKLSHKPVAGGDATDGTRSQSGSHETGGNGKSKYEIASRSYLINQMQVATLRMGPAVKAGPMRPEGTASLYMR